jgi:hypothetical protein
MQVLIILQHKNIKDWQQRIINKINKHVQYKIILRKDVIKY